MDSYPPPMGLGTFPGENELQQQIEAAEAQIRVVYHSIELALGPWVASGEAVAPNTDPWRILRLDELGYFAGPVELLAQDSFERAKAHYDATRADRATKGLDAALLAGDNAIPWIRSVGGDGTLADVAVGDDLKGVDLRTYVDTIGFDANYLNSDDIPLRDQHLAGKEHLLKHNVEARRLNRPTIALEATLHLMDVLGKRATVPEAVGPVRIDWVIEDVAEDVGLLYADDPTTSGASQSYIQKARTDLGLHNCPRSCGGIAEPGVHSAPSAAWLGGHYVPYEAEASAGVVFSRAYAERVHARALGKAGLLLRPSLIAGDTYRVTARVAFTEPNAGALDIANGAIEVVTGTIQNWRRAVLASYLPWPARPGPKQIQPADWQRVQQELAKAYVFFDIDPNAIPTDTPAAILDAAKYKAWIEDALFYAGGNDKRTEGQKTGATLATDFGISTVVSDATPVVLTHNRSQSYMIKDVVTMGLFGGKSASAFPNAPRKELYVGSKQFIDMVIDSVRATKARGFIVGDVDGFVSVSAQYPTLAAQNLFCVGMRDLACFIDHNADYPRGFMLTHEMAHCLWLRHSERAGEPVLEDHDRDDHYCMMSYPEPDNAAPAHLQQANFDPHFCGKCNLKLRGWNVRAKGLSNGSG
jgi:hypothetical protein